MPVIVRDADIDDDGTGTTGTVHNNAWKQQIYNRIDALAALLQGKADLLALTGFGLHTISAGGSGAQALKVANTTAGVSNLARLQLTAGTVNTYLDCLSQTYTTAFYAWQAGLTLLHDGAGGISYVVDHAAGMHRWYTSGATERLRLTAGGALALQAARPIFLDGVGATGDTYILGESTADRIEFTAGGVTTVGITPTALQVGGSAARTTPGTNLVNIFNGTAPAGTLTNGISLYSTAGELRVMDAAGNATLLSPHDAVTGEWIYDSIDTVRGRRLRVDMERLIAAVERLTGETFAHRSEAARG